MSKLPLLALAAALLTGASAQAAAPPVDNGSCMAGETLGHPGEVVVEMDRRAPMRDGAMLSIDVYRIADSEKRPTLFTLTPYGNLVYDAKIYCDAIRHGYNMLLAHVRGTWVSTGPYVGQEGDGRDGYDTVAWIRRQHWSDGRVGMWGPSYMGGDQWQTAATLPPGLLAIAPDVAVQPANWFADFRADDVRWLMGHSTEQAGTLYHDHDYWNRKTLDSLRQGKTLLQSLDDLGVSNHMAVEVRRWMDPVGFDARRRALTLTASDYRGIAKAGVQILVLAGFFDSVHNDDMQFYEDFRQANPGAEGHDLQLWLGPWQHWVGAEFGGLKFGSDADLSWRDKMDVQFNWFDHVFKGAPLPPELAGPVNYYQMGLQQGWRTAPSLEALTDHVERLYLTAEAGQAKSIFNAGALSAQPADGTNLELRYDPRVVGYIQDAQLRSDFSNNDALTSLQGALSQADKLVFVSAPLASEQTIAGRPKLHVFAKIDVPDTSLMATLYAIEPDGRTVVLGNAYMQARYALDPLAAKLVQPGEIREYKFDDRRDDYGQFHYLARREPAGTRLVLAIAPPTELSNTTNFNTGGVIGNEDMTKARAAVVQMLRSGAYTSFIEIPYAATAVDR